MRAAVEKIFLLFGRVKAKVKPHRSTQQRRKTGRKRHRFGSRSPYDRGGGGKVGEKAIKAKQRRHQAGRRTALIEWEGVGGKERILGRGQVRFPCPAGPWGVVAADVTSGAPPLSLHLHNFPSLWSGVQPVTSWLVCRGGGTLRSITPLSSPCKNKQSHQ